MHWLGAPLPAGWPPQSIHSRPLGLVGLSIASVSLFLLAGQLGNEQLSLYLSHLALWLLALLLPKAQANAGSQSEQTKHCRPRRVCCRQAVPSGQPQGPGC